MTRLLTAVVLVAVAWLVGGVVGMVVFEGRRYRPVDVEAGIDRAEAYANHPSGRAS